MRQVLVATIEPWLDEVYGASVLDLFESLSKLGYSVRILLPSHRSRLVKKGRLHIEAVRLEDYIPIVTKVRIWAHFLQLALRQEKLSGIVVDFYFVPILLLIRILRRTRAVMLIPSRPVPAVGAEAVGRIEAIYFRLSLMLAKHLADAITAITPMEAEEFRRLGNMPREKMVVIPSPVSQIFFEHKPPLDGGKTKRELGMDLLVNKKVILYHGEIDECRAVTEVLNEFTTAFGDRDEFVLLVLGAGSAKERIEMRIQQKELKNCVVMGPVPYTAVPEFIASCDLGLVILPDRPWWRYQCPTKLLEFLAMRKPVVASDLPGMRWAAGDSSLVTFTKTLKAGDLKAAITTALATGRVARNADSERVGMFASTRLASRLDSIIRGEAQTGRAQ